MTLKKHAKTGIQSAANSIASAVKSAVKSSLNNSTGSSGSSGSSGTSSGTSASTSSGGSGGYRSYDTSGNDYASMAGMSDLHKAALKAAGDAYNSATTQEQRDAAHQQAESIRSLYGYSGGGDGSQYIYTGNNTGSYVQNLNELKAQLEELASQKPSYSGDTYDTSKVINQLTNMDYADWTQSDQYKALADRYGNQGQMSMQDVLGQISSRTGGLASSYATTAAQQQYNEYMSQLEEVARQMYSNDRSDLAENLSVMNSANDTAYNRYLNELGQYNTDYSNAYGAYRDAVGDLQYSQEQDYQKSRDALSDERYNQEYADSRSDYADSQAATSKADAQNRINAYLAAYGAVGDLDADLVSASGYTQSELNTLAKYYADQRAQEQAAAAAAAVKSSSSSSGSRRSSSSGSKSGSSKPTLTAAQTLSALENGIVNDTTRAAYEYYYGQPYDDGGTEDSGSISENAQNILNSLKSMRSQTGSNKAIEKSIAVYADQGQLTDAEARYLFEYFGYDPDEWLE